MKKLIVFFMLFAVCSPTFAESLILKNASIDNVANTIEDYVAYNNYQFTYINKNRGLYNILTEKPYAFKYFPSINRASNLSIKLTCNNNNVVVDINSHGGLFSAHLNKFISYLNSSY